MSFFPSIAIRGVKELSAQKKGKESETDHLL